MFTVQRVSRSVLLFLVITALATTAKSAESPTPSGKVSIQSRSIAAGIGVTWGDGKLSFKGKDYPFSIDGLTLVDFGISRASASGEVYNLADVGMILRNQDGVLMRIHSTTRGARLQLGTSGLVIKLKQ